MKSQNIHICIPRKYSLIDLVCGVDVCPMGGMKLFQHELGVFFFFFFVNSLHVMCVHLIGIIDEIVSTWTGQLLHLLVKRK